MGTEKNQFLVFLVEIKIQKYWIGVAAVLRSFKAQLIAICIFSLLVLPIVMFTSSSVIRTVFTFPVAFFLPGYTLLLVFYPRKSNLSGLERLLISFVLSQAIVPLVLLALNFIWNLTLYPSLVTVTLITLFMAVIAWWQQKQLLPDERFTISIHRSSVFKLNVILRSRRFILWLLLIALTISILLFPVNITLDPSTIQSLHIFSSLPLFAGLFLCWMATLLFLLFSDKNPEKNDWQRLALICIFSVVFLSYWTILTPNSIGGDSIANLGTVRYLQLYSKIPNPPVRYLNFPGVFLFTNFIVQLSKLDIFMSGNLLLIFDTTLFCALIYLFFTKLIKNSHGACLALLLAAILGQLIRIEYRPDTLGYVLLAGFLVLLTREGQLTNGLSRDNLIIVILLGAITITYLMHSELAFFILVGIIVIQVFRKKRKIDILLLLSILASVFILSWEVYWATQQFGSTVAFLPSLLARLKSLNLLSTPEQAQNASLGVIVPLWAVCIRYFRLVLFYVLGTIISLITLAKFKKLDSSEITAVGGFLGVGLISALLVILYPSGEQYTRYEWYAPMFIAPIIVMLYYRQTWQKYITIIFISILFVTSLPIFLTNGSSISAAYVSPEDRAAGEFLNIQYGEGHGLTIYSNYAEGGDIFYYYNLEAQGIGPPEYPDLKNVDELLQDEVNLVTEFQASKGNCIFVYSERRALGYYELFGIKPDDTRWQNIKNQLAGINGQNIIFSNNYVHIYRQSTSDTQNAYLGN